MTTELHRAPHKVCDLGEKSIGLLFLYPEIRYFMTECTASYVVPGGFQPGGFQHGLTSFPVIMDESGLHTAGWGMFRGCLLCGKPGREVGLYLEVGTGIRQANPNVAELTSGQQGPPSLYWSQKPGVGLRSLEESPAPGARTASFQLRAVTLVPSKLLKPLLPSKPPPFALPPPLFPPLFPSSCPSLPLPFFLL